MNKELETNIYANIRELAMIVNQFALISKENDSQNAMFYINKKIKEVVLDSISEIKCELKRTGTNGTELVSHMNNYIKGN